MSIKITTDDFINQARNVHGDTYDYTTSVYRGQHKPLTITCKIHGPFTMRPNNHVRGGQHCPLCGSGKKRTTEDFITLAREVHGKLYDYSNAEYKNAVTKIEIICSIHGAFHQTPDMHCFSYKQGCPSCKSSKGERQIYKTLMELGITNFSCEHTFSDCVNPNTSQPLRYDFFIPKLNTLIEYDGQQHYMPTKFSNSMSAEECEEALILTRMLDGIKTTFATAHGIKLLRIPYTEYDNIRNILSNELL